MIECGNKGYHGEVYNCVLTDSPLVNLTDMMYNFRHDQEVGLNLWLRLAMF